MTRNDDNNIRIGDTYELFLDRKKRILHSPNHLISSKSLLYLFIALGSISARAIIRSYK